LEKIPQMFRVQQLTDEEWSFCVKTSSEENSLAIAFI
jgi:hypothetical protein